MRTTGLIGVSIAVLASTGCSGSGSADPRIDPPKVRIAIASVVLVDARSYTGVVVSRVLTRMGFRVAGKIADRLVDIGQHVEKGQPLMRLDPGDLDLGVTVQAEQVESARARSMRADADLARLDGLVGQGAVAAQEFDRTATEAAAARAQLHAAEAQAGLSRNAKAYGVLVAEVAGIVVATLGDRGQVVAAGQTVVEIANDGPREAAIALPETVRPAPGSTARATLYGQARSTTATLRELSLAAEPVSRTFAARYVLEGVSNQAPIGATVSLTLVGQEGSQALGVPLGALVDTGSGPSVWVLNGDSTVTRRSVTVAGVGDESATVIGGLRAGERFVALGAQLLHDGEPVRIAVLPSDRESRP